MNETEKYLIWLENFVQKGGIVQGGINWSHLVGQVVNYVKSTGNPKQLIRLDQFLTAMGEKE
jgi:hypothetical protein